MTRKQKDAITQLEAAFKLCSDVGLYFAGINRDFYYASKKAFKVGQNICSSSNSKDGWMPEVVECRKQFEGTDEVGDINTHGTYTDSGGW